MEYQKQENIADVLFAVSVALGVMAVLGVPALEAIRTVVWAVVAAIEPTLADALAAVLAIHVPELVPRGVDAIVTVAPVLGERGGAPVGIVGAAGVSLLYWRRRSGPSE
jgi:hypothetical protein